MVQQVMTAPGTVTFRDTEIPRTGPDQVLVRIKRIGVCGSDIHVWHGTHPYTSYPVTQGHEVSGQIVEVGEYVRDLRAGQKVTIEPQVFCGRCYPCLHGKYNLCEKLKVMGFQTTGTASEYFAVDASKVTPIPEEMTYSEGAMIEPLAVTVHAAKRFPEIKGARAAVLGCGPIGILLCQSLKAFGAAEVFATDISDTRLRLAGSLGADYTVNTAREDFGEALVKAFGPDKADVIFDCAGTDMTMEQAIQNARKGSTIILVAVFGKRASVDLAKLNDSELDLNTSMMYRHEDYLDAIRFVEEGKIRLKPLQSAHFSFDRYQEAYEYIDQNREKTMKVLIDVDPTEKDDAVRPQIEAPQVLPGQLPCACFWP
ncbi:MAG: alcohol dehydrogenase catalytic domain-containing protein [Clostridia bacterium]|nr:alcohol dehydrogenase catalytic domain-containing protein [Clostridia bacterium]